jgi:hypothetical protein
MKICKIAEIVRIVIESDVLVRFVTPDGEGTKNKYFGME